MILLKILARVSLAWLRCVSALNCLGGNSPCEHKQEALAASAKIAGPLGLSEKTVEPGLFNQFLIRRTGFGCRGRQVGG